MKDFFEFREGNKSELTEAPDLMKMSKELLKHKSKGVNYEKAAAYVRAIHNNSNVNVQDKAMKGLLDLLKNMDLTDRTTITKILKDNGFKVKGGRLMRESVELDESPAEKQAIIDGRKAARQGKKYSDNPHKKGSKEFTAWSKGHNQGRTTHKESAEENLDEISTGLLKRARDKASKNTVDARNSATKNTKKHLKDPEGGHGIKALKDYDKADKSRRQKKHFDKALKKRSANESVELDEAKTVKVSRADFDKLKKGSVIDIDWDGAMSAGAAALKVVSKSRSAKYDVEKIKLMPTSGGRSAPFYLYSRKGGDATLAIGDMGASMTKYKIVKESVELDEAVAKVKTTMPDKVASGAQRFGLKATTKGGHVSISGSKGKLNDFMRAIIGRSSYGNASNVTESVELEESVWTPQQVKAVAKLDKEFASMLAKKGINPTSQEASKLWSANFKKRMNDIFESVELTEKNTIDIAREIVKTKGAKHGLDMQSANLILKVYDKVNDKNKKKMETMSPSALGKAVWKIYAKMQGK